MPILLSIAAALLLVLAPAAGAANLPFADKFEEVLVGAAGREAVPQPEPTALTADWWRFFNVPGEALEKRIQAVLERLDKLPDELAPESRDAVRPLIGLIRLNLQALPDAKAQPAPEPPPPPVYGKTYTLAQLLEIAERLRRTQAELQDERDDTAAAERSLRAANRRIDNLMAAYLGLAPDDPNRAVRGLEIMSEGSAAAVAQERLRVRRGVLLANETRVKHLSNELAAAAERLDAKGDDRDSLEKAIKQARAGLERAKERLVNEQSRALRVAGDNPEDRATSRNRQQRVVQAAVEEVLATVRLIRFQAEGYLVALLRDTLKENTQTLRGQLSEWNAQLATIRQDAIGWTTASERERERAGGSLAEAPREAAVVTPLALINEERLRLAQETLQALQRLQDELTQTELILRLVNEKLAEREGGLRNWWIRIEFWFQQFWNRTTGWAGGSLFKIGDTPVTALGILRVVLIITLAWWLSRWLRRALDRMRRRREEVDSGALYTVGRLSHYFLILVGVIVGLASIGLDFTNFALVAGAIAIGIGFGLQSIVNNFVSGLILLFERSLKVGDFVELASGIAGEVREINVRSTLINTNDNVDIVVPNSEFMNTKVVNWTLSEGYCRIHLPFRVAYGTDKETVKQAGLEAAEKLPHTLKGIPGRNPNVWLVRFGDNGLEFELVVWITPRAVKRPGAVHAAYLWEIESALRRHGIEVPYPQRDLHLRSGFREGHQPEVPDSTVKPRMELAKS